MHIRKTHPIRDRVKLIVFLFVLMIILGVLAQVVFSHKNHAKTATIERLLKTAMKPVGITMYIWGGGWDGADQASGATSTQIGLCAQWLKFAGMQDENYNFKEHRYERENGLDCSGYVGWVLYNTFEKESGQAGYVTASTDMAKQLAERGWGKLIKNPKQFLAGDIISMEGHVWICLGTCEDGSVLLVHSSPPGVSVCGTNGIAVLLATEYMTEKHSKWQEMYPNREVSLSYLENVTVFRWNKSVMSDAEEIQSLNGEEIVRILTSDMVQ